jgi:pyrroline-5-carboxylate reductase
MKLGVIGCGKMGRALVGGILKAGIVEAAETIVFDTWSEAAAGMANDMGVRQAGSNEEVVTKSDVVLLCVKPQGFLDMLEEIGDTEDKLLISIAAGVKISSIESACDNRHRIVRVIPLPSLAKVPPALRWAAPRPPQTPPSRAPFSGRLAMFAK